MTILIIVGIIVLLGIIFASMYNSLVKLRNNRENAFADIDVQLKQRHDLIPQLVDTVKGYAAHEKETLDRVILGPVRTENHIGSLSRPESKPEFPAITGRNC